MENTKPKRVPVGSIHLQFAGELIMPKLPDPQLAGMFRRYQVLFENFANMDREERLINYKMINALMLTSYAKKVPDPDLRKRLFTFKNELYYDLSNNRDTRRKMAFKYLTSKNFRVLEFCASCVKKNTEQGIASHQWKFCQNCKVDRSFYNVLSMHHRFNNGFSTLFLSNDLIHNIKGIVLKNRGKLTDHDEESRVDRFQFNVRNLDSFALQAVLDMFKKLLPHYNMDAAAIDASAGASATTPS